MWLIYLFAMLGMMSAHGSPKKNTGGSSMLKAFNAFQMTVLFSAMPFLLMWLSKADFQWAQVAFWLSMIVYLVMFCGAVVCAFIAIEGDRR